MRIVVAGGSGLIGTSLIEYLRRNGHEVIQLVRRTARSEYERNWDPSRGVIAFDALEGVDAVINLAGVGVGDRRWTKKYKQEILQSRINATDTLVRAIAESPHKPRVLLNASAIGFYGERGDDVVDETSAKGKGFLADVVERWESAAFSAATSGVRVATLRTGLVLTPKGGAFGKLLPLFKLGIGGIIGSGKQFWSFISLTDEIRAIDFLLTHEVSGPVNLTAPNPARNREVTKTLARLLHRPALLPVPAIALRIVIGEFSSDITGGACVRPTKLETAGFTWSHPTIDVAIRAEVLKTQ